MNKLCLIYNTAPRYREAIFRAIDNEYDCDWYFGETKTDIKEMDLNLLKNTKYYNSYGNPRELYWQGALIPALFKKKYKNYFVLAESRSISFWIFVILKNLFFKKKRIYGWSHGWYGREGKIRMILDKWRFNHMDGSFVYNERAKLLMEQGGIIADKIHVIGNSLDYETHIKIRNTLKLSDIYKNHFKNNHPVIIFIARLTKVKQLNLLLEAVGKLRDKNEFYNVVFVGDGEEKGNLQKIADDSHLPVWFYGASYDEYKNAELIYNADLCVAPGNIGLTAMHVLTFGTPAITHNEFTTQMPEFESIKEGLTGNFFEKGNVDSLADAISSWFRKGKDREEVRKACYSEIDKKWNPYYQMNVIKENLKLR